MVLWRWVERNARLAFLPSRATTILSPPTTCFSGFHITPSGHSAFVMDSVPPASSPHATSVVAAAASGASMGSVFVKHAGDARAHFARVPILVGDAVTDLAKRASRELDWRTSAAYVELFLVPISMERVIQRNQALEADVLVDANRCLATDMLAEAGIRDLSCLLARLTDSPVAVPGEWAREPVSLLSCSRS